MDVRLPDGTVVRNVPDTMSKADFKAMATRNGYKFPDEPAAPPATPSGLDTTAQAYRLSPSGTSAPGYLEQFAGGAKHALDRAALGLEGAVKGAANLLPGVNWERDPENVENVKRGEAFVKQTGPASTVGQIAGDLAMSAAPVARGSALMAQALRGVGLAAPLTADVVANAGYSALTAPEDRAKAALFGAGGAVAGRVLNRTLSGMVRPRAEAQPLLDQGVRMTPGQAGEGVMGSAAKIYEDALSTVPLIGRRVKAAQEQGLKDWNRSVLANARGPLALEKTGREVIDPAADIGQKGIDALKAHYSEAYGQLFPKGGTIQLTDDGVKALNRDIAQLSVDLPASLQGKFDELATGITHRLKNGVPAPLWKETIEGDIDAMRQAAFRNGDNSLGRALTALDKKLLSHMEAGHLSGAPSPHALADVDTGYKQFKVLQKAGEKAAAIKRSGTLYPSEVAVEAFKRGEPRITEQALQAQQMFGNAPSEMTKWGNAAKALAIGGAGGLAGLKALPATTIATISAIVGTTEVGRKVLLGQYPWAKYLAENPGIVTQIGRAVADQQGQLPVEQGQ